MRCYVIEQIVCNVLKDDNAFTFRVYLLDPEDKGTVIL
jgi:hypothetical protein